MDISDIRLEQWSVWFYVYDDGCLDIDNVTTDTREKRIIHFQSGDHNISMVSC